MRILHCTVALLLLAGAAAAQAPSGAGASAAFTVFLRGTPIGTEDVTVTRTAGGTSISGTARLGPPLQLTVRRAEIRYAPDGSPLECTIEGSIGDQLLGIRTVVSGRTATTDSTQGLQTGRKVDQLSPMALLLPNVFFGSYEALAARVLTSRTGDELRMYIPAQAEIGLRIGRISEETIRTPAAAVRARRVAFQIENPAKPVDGEIWTDQAGRLLRLTVPVQALDYARNDIVSVASRREPISHPGDERFAVPANGFTLESTLSKPAGVIKKGVKLPAVVLVAGSGEADRDEAVAGIPIFGQLASALADAGFIVVRYDRRGVGQSGGRVESVSLQDYADDVRAVVRALRRRKDVDRKRIAAVGYGEGGAAAMLAAQQDEDVKALALVASPGGTGAEIVLERQARALAAMQLSGSERQAKVDLQKKINEAVLTGKGWSELPPNVRRQADTSWFRSFLAFDPSKVMPKVRQPILFVIAGLDREVPAASSQKLEALARARKRPAGALVTRVDIPGVNHLFLPATTGEVDEYGQSADKSISPRLPAAVADWLRETWASRK